jgi:ABC-type sulfate transport system permease subunit
MLSDWVSFLVYPNLFGIKGFVVVCLFVCLVRVLVNIHFPWVNQQGKKNKKSQGLLIAYSLHKIQATILPQSRYKLDCH